MIGWYIGILGLLASMVTMYYFIKVYANIYGGLRATWRLFVATGAVMFVYSSLVVVLGFTKTPLSNGMWNLIPLLTIATSSLFLLSMGRLKELIDYLSEEK